MSWGKMTLTFEELKLELQKQGPNISFKDFEGYVDLDMEYLPDGIQSITIFGTIESHKLKSLPDNITLEVTKESIRLPAVEVVGNNVTIKAISNVEMDNLVTMGNNATIKSHFVIIMPKLVKLGDNAIFNSCIGWIDLNGLVEMGNNVTITSKWEEIRLNSLVRMGANVTFNTDFIVRLKSMLSKNCTADIGARQVVFMDKACAGNRKYSVS